MSNRNLHSAQFETVVSHHQIDGKDVIRRKKFEYVEDASDYGRSLIEDGTVVPNSQARPLVTAKDRKDYSKSTYDDSGNVWAVHYGFGSYKS